MSITSNAAKVRKRMDRLQKDLKFVEAVALTKTAAKCRDAVTRSMDREIDRPTGFTKKAMAIRPATKVRLKASVHVKDLQARYLRTIIKGGTRKPKGQAIVVPVKARLNRFGNLSRKYLVTQLAKPNVFSGNINGVAGMFQRMRGGKLKMLIAYEKQASYRRTFDPGRTIRRTALRQFPIEYRRQFNRTIRKV